MARDIDKRLRQLNTRRRGTDRLSALTRDARTEVLSKSLTAEAWQKRAPTQPYTRYALGVWSRNELVRVDLKD